jgi:fatty acid desaturase
MTASLHHAFRFLGEKMEQDLIMQAAPPSTLNLATEQGPKFKSVGYYRQVLSENLSPEIFKPHPSRLVWYFASISISVTLLLTIVNAHLSWPLKLLCALGIGFCNGTLGFTSHEILHGSVIKNQRAQMILAFFGSLPFFVSPTFWKFWHNRLHHGKTQQLIRDPDAFPNMRIYKTSKFTQRIFPFTPGSGHKRSSAYFFFWFSFHNFISQIYFRFRNSIFDGINQTRVSIEFSAQIILAAGILYYAGPSNWLWVFVIPLFIQNYMLMSYISTNHNLSPLTSDNDPLVNSLTVTNNPIIEFLNLNFGYHVEHHIFPTMSSRHVKLVHHELLKRFPDSYKVMPKWKAMKALYSTARIYKNSRELINPNTLKTYPTI